MKLSIITGVFALALQGVAAAQAPSFDCSKLADNAPSAEKLVCSDPALAALDRQLADTYKAAQMKAVNEHPPTLKAEQRGWIKGRNECWKSGDLAACVAQSYRTRNAELQARYRLVAMKGPFSWRCGDNSEVIISYFDTDPATAIAERGDSVSLMFVDPSGSGARYQGPNESVWEHQGEAEVVWGYGAPALKCTLVP